MIIKLMEYFNFIYDMYGAQGPYLYTFKVLQETYIYFFFIILIKLRLLKWHKKKTRFLGGYYCYSQIFMKK